ncbi:MAG TPA: chromosomal replication initiator protein DnaA [Ktedonobacteraceae bacterium]|nr:chromosomal replication initiator protein DnaA [Ktedonobacteraceae bacterium]
MNAKQIWQTVIERIQKKVSPQVFTTWFAGSSAISFQGGIFVVGVPTMFIQSYLEDHFLDKIHAMLEEITGGSVEVQIVVMKDQAGQSEQAESIFTPLKRPYRLARGRLSGRGDKRANDDAAAMRSIAPFIPHPNAHRHPKRARIDNGSTPLELLPLMDPEQSHAEAELPYPPQQVRQLPFIASPPTLLPGAGPLSPRYTFNSFIVGKSNQLAHAASLAVSENPGHIYNPLFLYGGVGLGKTHLLHAVGNVGEAAGLTVLYTTSEKFTNEIVNAIRFKQTEEFRAKYRQIDILLVDDIQFIAGKESTEEEFFHTFNTLHDAYKQIVVTSDRPPKAIPSLQDRLRSRFEWGLLADVQPPEYEHRLAILRSKCDSLHFVVPSAVTDYVARTAFSSVRELEGALNRVIAYATLHDAPITVSLAAQALENIYHTAKKSQANLTVAEVLAGVCHYYNVDNERLRGKQRDRDNVWPRQVAMYLMREETSASLLQIGNALGGRDHTTIMHGWEKVYAEIQHNERIRREVAAVLELVQQKQG